MKILAINPGSTSTKIAIYEDIKPLFTKTLRHSAEEIAEFPTIFDQYEFRKNIILEALKESECNISNIDFFVGRGGLVKPIPSGVYLVNEAMLVDLRKSQLGEHASNLGGVLAYELMKSANKKDIAYIVDPVVVDELDELARYSGRPELPRISIFHALNQKAVARRHCRENNLDYNNTNLIVVHLGGGITVGAHKNGKVVEVNNGLDGDGPFSPERTGSLPAGQLAKLCFSGKYQLHEIRKMITGKGGMVAYLNTNNAQEIEERIEKGDYQAQTIYLAMAYQIAKEIGSCSAVLAGNVDGILITGGMAHSELLCKWIIKRVEFISKCFVYPGEDEMQALAEGVYFSQNGEIPLKEYV